MFSNCNKYIFKSQNILVLGSNVNAFCTSDQELFVAFLPPLNEIHVYNIEDQRIITKIKEVSGNVVRQIVYSDKGE